MSSRKEQKAQLKAEREQKERELKIAQAKKRKMAIIFGVLALSIIMLASVIIVGSTNKKEEANAVNFNGIPQKEFTLGNENAPYTLYEYADLKCPFCKQFATTGGLQQLIDGPVKSGDLKIIFRPIHFLDQATPGTPDSKEAALFSVGAAQQNKAWEFVDQFYINQKEENEIYVTDAFLKEISSKAGVNYDKAAEVANSNVAEEELILSDKEFKKHGLSGTPAFVLVKEDGKPQIITLSALDNADSIIEAIN